MHNNSKLLFEKHAITSFKDNDIVLELGAHVPSPFKESVENHGIKIKYWRYADIVSDRSAVYADKIDYMMQTEYDVPEKGAVFDVVFSAQVLEHVRKPWIWIKELSRLLKRGGKIITISPVSWPYHEAPIDCWRAHPEGMRALYEEGGIETEFVISACCETTNSIIPGRGMDILKQRNPMYYKINKILSCFDYPVEASVDCLTIGKKI